MSATPGNHHPAQQPYKSAQPAQQAYQSAEPTPQPTVQPPVSSLAEDIVATCRQRHLTLATCESLTAGWVAGAVAAVPGASAVLRGGLLTYATDLKTSLAGVDAAAIERYGVVSSEVAERMAAGAQRVCQADIGLGITGVAGPAAVADQPVGRIWIAVAYGPSLSSRRVHGSGTRDEIRRFAVQQALELLNHVLMMPQLSVREQNPPLDR